MVDQSGKAGVVLTGAVAVLVAAVALAADPLPAIRAIERARLERAGARFLDEDGIVLQDGLRDCGPSALARLLALHGRPGPGPDSLAVLAGTGPVGTSLGGLARAARAAGLDASARRLSPDHRPPAPLLVWVDRSHFVVVEGVAGGRVTIADPAVGRYTMPAAGFVRRWTGEALVVADPGEIDHPNREAAMTERSPP